MPYNGLKELTYALTRAWAVHQLTVNEDVSDKGEPVTLFVIPHPTEARYGVAVEAKETKAGIRCALWFGSVLIAPVIPDDQILAAVEEILSDRIVAVVKYKHRDAYDDRHPSGWQKVFQLTRDHDSDEGAFRALMTRLTAPPTFADRLPGGPGIGVFEIARWSSVSVVDRINKK